MFIQFMVGKMEVRLSTINYFFRFITGRTQNNSVKMYVNGMMSETEKKSVLRMQYCLF